MKKMILFVLIIALLHGLSACKEDSILQDTSAGLQEQLLDEKIERIEETQAVNEQLERYLESDEHLADYMESIAHGELSYAENSIIEFGGINWIVLDVQDDRMLIITERIIEKRMFCEDETKWKEFVSWCESDLRLYLNNGFYNSFDENERKKIIKVTNHTPDNPWLIAPSVEDTEDYVFLLSLDEVLQYFGDSEQLYYNLLEEAIPSEDDGFGVFYWFFDDERWVQIDDEFNFARIAYDSEGEALDWFLRSPGLFSGGASAVTREGHLDVIGWTVGVRGNYGVRPALWLNIG